MKTAILIAGCATLAQAQLAQPAIARLPNGTVRVTNNGPSAWTGSDAWELRLEKTITPEEGSPGMLGRPYKLGVSRSGEVIVSDWKANGLLVFDKDGKYLRRIGGTGAGPGEFQPGMNITVRGDTVAGHADGRVLVWRTNGDLLSQWITPESGSDVYLDGRGHVLAGTTLAGPWPGLPAVVRYRFDGTAVDTLRLPARQMAGWRTTGGGLAAVPFRPVRIGRFDSQSRYVAAFSSEYTFRVSRNGADTALLIVMPGTRIPLAKSLRDSTVERTLRVPILKGIAKADDIPTEHPFFYNFEIDEHDNLWVARPDDHGATAYFDVIDSKGTFLGSVKAPPGTTTAVFANGRMYRFAENADGVPVIEIYRILKG